MRSSYLTQAVTACRAGGVIAYPTEAVFGLGCIPLLQHSINRILQLKCRSVEKGLIVVASSIAQLDDYVDFGKLAMLDKIRDSWPGPVTWLVPAREATPSWLTGAHETLAVRVSAHPVVVALCRELGPLVSTSANPSGASPARSSRRVRAYFGADVDYVFPAYISNNMNPTEIRDAETGRIIRLR